MPNDMPADPQPSQVDVLARAFIACSLPKEAWTHHAHLKVGLWHVHRHGAEQALDLLRERIRAYNVAVGTVNSDHSGYHETLTRLYVHLTALFVTEFERSVPLDTLAEILIDRLGARELPTQHYSRERLFSVQARRNWIEPDRLALPPLPASRTPES